MNENRTQKGSDMMEFIKDDAEREKINSVSADRILCALYQMALRWESYQKLLDDICEQIPVSDTASKKIFENAAAHHYKCLFELKSFVSAMLTFNTPEEFNKDLPLYGIQKNITRYAATYAPFLMERSRRHGDHVF